MSCSRHRVHQVCIKYHDSIFCHGSPSGDSGWSVLGSALLVVQGLYSLLLMARWLNLRPTLFSTKRTLKDKQSRVVGSNRSNEPWGESCRTTPSPTLKPIYDDLDVTVTYNITWFHPSHDMVPCRIYTLRILRRALHNISPP